jgi:hypothetical protein
MSQVADQVIASPTANPHRSGIAEGARADGSMDLTGRIEFISFAIGDDQ